MLTYNNWSRSSGNPAFSLLLDRLIHRRPRPGSLPPEAAEGRARAESGGRGRHPADPGRARAQSIRRAIRTRLRAGGASGQAAGE
jgi:hypothetical protein